MPICRQKTTFARALNNKYNDTQRVLFATMPIDGHFNPLTGIAVHLGNLGHDVHWYVDGHYGEKVTRFGLHYYLFNKAKTVNQENLGKLFGTLPLIKTNG